MKSKRMGSRILGLALTVALSGLPAFAQNASTNQNGNNNVKTDSRMLYHNGEVIHSTAFCWLPKTADAF